MSAVSGLLGTAGGTNGTGFNVQTPVSNQQVQNALTTGTQALQQQQGLAQQYTPAGQQALASQQQLLAQLSQEAQGQGPNPALNQLAQATGANTSNQAALMAGQRGASQNAGLIARQAAQQGAQNQQQAAGQAATLSAQQQLANQQQLAAQQAQLTGQQMGAQSTYTQAAQGNQNALLNAIGGQNATQAGLAQTQMQGQQNLLGGLLGAAGSGLGVLSKAEGGPIHGYDVGGPVNSQQVNGPQSAFGQFLKGKSQLTQGAAQFGQGLGQAVGSMFKPSAPKPQTMAGGPADTTSNTQQQSPGAQTASDIPMMQAAEGGNVPAMVSPGEQYLEPDDVKKVKQGANPLAVGERIPGKPKYPGNDYRNDTVRKDLKEGGLVIPNKVMQSKTPAWDAMKFVHAHMAKGGKVPKSPKKNK